MFNDGMLLCKYIETCTFNEEQYYRGKSQENTETYRPLYQG